MNYVYILSNDLFIVFRNILLSCAIKKRLHLLQNQPVTRSPIISLRLSYMYLLNTKLSFRAVDICIVNLKKLHLEIIFYHLIRDKYIMHSQ